MDFNQSYQTEKNIPWKLIAIAAGGLVLLIIIIAVVFRVVGSGGEPLTLIQNDDVIQAETLIDSCANAEDKEGCEENASKDAAIITGSTQYCENLEGGNRDDCILGVAREVVDLKACTAIESEKVRVLCEDVVNRELAAMNNDTSFCDKLSTELKATGCKQTLGGTITSSNCSERGYEKDYCDFIEVTEHAIDAQDRSLCGALLEEYEESCIDNVLIDDADYDGLSGSQESQYGTDPHNADTDGDGYSDYDEIEAGYNPVGEGRL